MLRTATLLLALSFGVHPLSAQPRGAAALGPLVDGLGVTARVLMIAAHPDDEDTQLIAWLARGRQVTTAYLSLTRGDGGQNIIGDELGEPLGAIRTEELLSARRLDGGRQYFTRAFDFGFSKSAEETLTQWSRDSILRDMVTVIRAFRPHVIVSVFSGTPADGHGHHQAAGQLAREAWEVSGDTARLPRAATAGHGGWTVAKFYRSANFRNQERATLRIDVGRYDPVLGRSYAELAADSRSQHRSQAMGTLPLPGVRWDLLIREATRTGPSDPRREQSLLDGVDTTWARFRAVVETPAQRTALDALPAAFRAARANLDLRAPSGALPALAQVRRQLQQLCGVAAGEACRARAALAADFHSSMQEAIARADRALVLAAGVHVETLAARELFALGDTVRVLRQIFNRGGRAVRVRAGSALAALAPDSARVDTVRMVLPRRGAPWWLVSPRQGPMFGVPGRATDEAIDDDTPRVITSLEVEGVPVDVTTSVVYRWADPVRGEVRAPVVGAPAVTVMLDRAIEFARASAPLQRTVDVTVRSHAVAPREVDVRLILPPGLTTDSSTRRVRLRGREDGVPVTAPQGPGATATPATPIEATLSFPVRGSVAPGRHTIRVEAMSGGERFTDGYRDVAYDHIRTQRLYRPATLDIEAVDLTIPAGARVAYLNGVGDNSAPMLQQLGVDVTLLDPADLPRTDLARFTAVVVGTRAYEASPALVAHNARLLQYARDGGTLVVQYGQYEMLQPGIMPWPITLGRPADRVTVENAPVRVLPGAPAVLAAPNVITARDFEGWVQDRSLYMPRSFDPAYQPVLELNDPGEPPNRGAILVAPYGRGVYVYTTLAFFRQLPLGVPGAARLFLNLLAARPAGITQ